MSPGSTLRETRSGVTPSSSREEVPLRKKSSPLASREGTDDDIVGLHQQANGPLVHIDRAEGNLLIGPNYGNVTQTIEEFGVSHNTPVHPCIHGHVSDCFPESRSDDAARIREWIDSNHTPELVLYVVGKVGVGKSTLAKHVAASLGQDKRLAADIFFGFALPDWRPESVLRLAASQLCRNHPALRRAVTEAIDLDVGPSVSLETRAKNLILEPIRSLHLPHPLVVVLDALDQWAPHPIFIQALSCLATESHLIKLIIFGRPGVSESVMEKYFMERFSHIRWPYGRQPSAETVKQLVKTAEGLFIWSATLCSLLEDELGCPNPNDILTATLQFQHRVGDNEILANLYHGAINLRFPKPEHKAKLKTFLGAVIVLQESLAISAFASLTSLDASTIQNIQAALGALKIGQQQGTPDTVHPASSLFHLSFLEYLQIPDTPSSLAFPIETFHSHSQLGQACLEELHRIVTSPESTFTSPLQSYATRYWPMHTTRGTPTVSPTSNAEWEATPHFALLERVSISQWQRWVNSYLQLAQLGVIQEAMLDDSGEQPVLESTGGKRPFPRRFLRELWRKLWRRPPHEISGTLSHVTPHRLISRVVALLLERPDVANTPDAVAVAELGVRLQHQSSQAWLDLGTAYREASQMDTSCNSIESAVRACRYAASRGGYEGHQVRWVLAVCLAERFKRLGLKEDPDEAISQGRVLLSLITPGHPDRCLSLNNLAICLQSHHEVTGSTARLEESITLNQAALSLIPPDSTNRPLSLNNLGIPLQSHHELTGSIASLEESIVLHREALMLWPQAHPSRSTSLNNLAECLLSHHKVTGSTASLEESIVLNGEALLLRPPGQANRSTSLNHLAQCLLCRHKMTGSATILEESIELDREALSLRPTGHQLRPASLDNLANSLQSQYEVLGFTASLEESIVLHREALSLRPPGHHYHTRVLKALAKSLQASYKSTGNIQHLNEATSLLAPAQDA